MIELRLMLICKITSESYNYIFKFLSNLCPPKYLLFRGSIKTNYQIKATDKDIHIVLILDKKAIDEAPIKLSILPEVAILESFIKEIQQQWDIVFKIYLHGYIEEIQEKL